MESLKLKNKKSCDEENSSFASPKYMDAAIKLSKDRNIFISEDFTKEMASSVIAFLIYYDNKDPGKDIKILLNSNGGDADALSAIYDAIQIISSPVKTICLGKSYSAAAILLASGSKGKRYATRNSSIMIHGLQCSFPVIGEVSQQGAENYYKYLEKSNLAIMKILAKHTGKPIQTILKDCSRDFYLDSAQAVKYGLIDHILE